MEMTGRRMTGMGMWERRENEPAVVSFQLHLGHQCDLCHDTLIKVLLSRYAPLGGSVDLIQPGSVDLIQPGVQQQPGWSTTWLTGAGSKEQARAWAKKQLANQIWLCRPVLPGAAQPEFKPYACTLSCGSHVSCFPTAFPSGRRLATVIERVCHNVVGIELYQDTPS
eukprot:357755-Chlamydomonas_euryale.AAC.3